jgi:hypothetical protein
LSTKRRLSLPLAGSDGYDRVYGFGGIPLTR